MPKSVKAFAFMDDEKIQSAAKECNHLANFVFLKYCSTLRTFISPRVVFVDVKNAKLVWQNVKQQWLQY